MIQWERGMLKTKQITKFSKWRTYLLLLEEESMIFCWNILFKARRRALLPLIPIAFLVHKSCLARGSCRRTAAHSNWWQRPAIFIYKIKGPRWSEWIKLSNWLVGVVIWRSRYVQTTTPKDRFGSFFLCSSIWWIEGCFNATCWWLGKIVTPPNTVCTVKVHNWCWWYFWRRTECFCGGRNKTHGIVDTRRRTKIIRPRNEPNSIVDWHESWVGIRISSIVALCLQCLWILIWSNGFEILGLAISVVLYLLH